MKEIELVNTGNKTLVDDRDYPFLSKFTWREDKDGYAIALIPMARLIKRPARSKVVDHINRKPLDNRRFNLRSVSQSVNMLNSKKRAGCSSIYRGVSWCIARQCWIVHVAQKNKVFYCGGYQEEHTAGLMYDFWCTFLYGKKAVTNFTIVSTN